MVLNQTSELNQKSELNSNAPNSHLLFPIVFFFGRPLIPKLHLHTDRKREGEEDEERTSGSLTTAKPQRWRRAMQVNDEPSGEQRV